MDADPGTVTSISSTGSLALLTTHSWNIYRYIGDYLHLGGVIVLIGTLAKNRAVTGISRSTQILYCSVFCTRYLDLFHHSQTEYLVFFKLTYIITSMIVLIVFWRLDSTYERQKDTCSLAFILIPCSIAAALLANDTSIMEIAWTFSQFCEGFAMVPQYIFCYRDNEARDMGVSFYVIALGGYRVFYALNWIYKKMHLPQYVDIHSWVGGIIEILFFMDFLNFRFSGRSMLRTLVLKVDERVNELKDSVHNTVIGKRMDEQLAELTEGGELRQRKGASKAAAAEEGREIEMNSENSLKVDEV